MQNRGAKISEVAVEEDVSKDGKEKDVHDLTEEEKRELNCNNRSP